MKNLFRYAPVFCIVNCLLLLHARAEPVSFSKDVASILLNNCQGCHGKKKAEGGYRVDTIEGALGEGDSGGIGFVGGNLDDSEAFRRMTSDDVSERMPLDRDPLSRDQISLLKRWIEEGAKFDEGQSTAPLAEIVAQGQQPDPPERYRHPVPATALQFSQDGKHLYVGSYHELTVWNVETGKLRRRIKNNHQRTMGIDFSSNRDALLIAGGFPGKYGAVRIFEPASGALKNVIGFCGDLVLDARYSPDGKRIATGTAESGLHIFDADSGKSELAIASHSDWVAAVAWSPDGSKLATASRDKTCKVFDAKTGELSISYTGHNQPVKGIVFHPNGTEVFSSGTDGKIHRWQISDGKKVAEIGFGDEVYKLPRVTAFLFAASADGTVRQIDQKTNKEIQQFKGHSGRPVSIDFHEASGRVAAGGQNGEVRIWDIKDGSPVSDFYAAPGYIAQAAAR